jgi:hypothetical protein
MKQKAKKFLELSDQEKTKAVQEYDREGIANTFHPLTVTEQARWKRIRRKLRRPRNGMGTAGTARE